MYSGRRIAPAKINLTLEVLAKRPDGYHALRSVAVPIALYDVLSWRPASAFAFHCSDRALANDDNLVVRAARAIELQHVPIDLHLEKHIPYGSGLGGGSSDAAALLLAAMHGAFGPQPDRDWLSIARTIGSDVPLFLVDAPALIEATGERVTALGANAAWSIVLVDPAVAISTQTAYAELAARSGRSPQDARSQSVSLRMIEALQRRMFAEVETLASNDFEMTAFTHPVVHAACTAIEALRRRPHLSGSGSAIYVLCESDADANALAAQLRDSDAIMHHGMQLSVHAFHQGATWQTA